MVHSAVLLAGGKSSRMGRDKSLLQIGGEPLWLRQLNTLRATKPRELFISGPIEGPYVGAGVGILPDADCNFGPISGITSALAACVTDWLLVLAVDLPFMTADYLSRMVQVATHCNAGIVPVTSGETFEPLAAIYPKRALPIAETRQARKQLKLSGLIEEIELRGWMQRLEVCPGDMAYFTNWNSPEDLPSSA